MKAHWLANHLKQKSFASLRVEYVFLESLLPTVDNLTLSVPCRTLAFPAPLFFANKRFVNHTIKNVRVRDLAECERLCYEEHNCVSINFETKKDGKGRYSCDLNNSTHGEHDGDLVNEDNYFYRGTEVIIDKGIKS